MGTQSCLKFGMRMHDVDSECKDCLRKMTIWKYCDIMRYRNITKKHVNAVCVNTRHMTITEIANNN